MMLVHRKNLSRGGQDAPSWNWSLPSCEFLESHLMVDTEGYISCDQLGEARVVHKVIVLKKKSRKKNEELRFFSPYTRQNLD